MIVFDLIYNLAILVSLCILAGFIRLKLPAHWIGPILLGLLFGGAAVIGMLKPLVLGPGLIFDGRSVVISLCGLFVGPVAAGVAAAMALVCRIVQGGVGMYMGIFVILASTLIGLVFYYRRARRQKSAADITAGFLLGFGILVHIAMLALAFTLPGNGGIVVLESVGLTVILAYPLATVLIGKVLSDQLARGHYIAALRESEEKYRILVEESTDPIFSFNERGEYLYVNPAFAAGVGKTHDEIIGRKMQDLFSGEGGERRFAALSEVFRTGRTKTIEVVVPHPDGDRSYVTTINPARDGSGRVVAAICSSKDFTARKAVEDALRESERRFRSLFDTMAQGVVYQSAAGEITAANSAAARILGWPGGSLVGAQGSSWDVVREDGSVFPPEEHPAMTALHTGKDVRDVVMGIHAPGEGAIVWILVNSRPEFHNGETVPWQVCTTFADITAIKRIERALVESEEKHRLLVEHSHDIIYTLTADGLFTFVSAAWTILLGNKPEDVVGRSFRDFVHPDDIPACEAWLARVIGGNQRLDGIEYRVRHADGSWRWHTTSAVPLADGNGDVNGFEGTARDISERKKIEEELIESEESLSTMLHSIGDGVIATDMDGRITLMNAVAERLTGFSGADAVGRNLPDIFRIVNAQTRAVAADPVRQVLTSGLTVGLANHTLLLARDGQEYQIADSAAPIRDARGRTRGVILVFSDVTEKYLAEASLAREREFSKRVVESMPGIFYLYSYPELRLVLWNRNHEIALGFSADEMRDRHLTDWHRPADRPAVLAAVEVSMEQGYNAVEGNLVAKDGHPVPYLLTGSGFTMDGHRYLLGSGIEITERKAAEKALRETKEYLENLLDSANAPIIVWDTDFRITRFNHAFETMTGKTAADVIGSRLDVLFPPEEADAWRPLILRAQQGERWESVEIGIRHVDGSLRTVLWNSANISGPDGTMLATIAQGYDITLRKKAEAENLRLEAQLRHEQKLSAVGTLANGVAHEINNPLTGILNYAQLVCDSLAAEQENAKTYCREIVKESDRIAAIVRNLLAFSRQEQTEHVREDLGSVTRAILSLTEKLLAKEQIQLLTDIAPDLPVVLCSSSQIQQVLLNLITNARDALNERYPGYDPNKQIRITVNEVVAAAGHCVRVAVSDTGNGIPAAVQEKMFEPFFTTKAAGLGTGLGLSISYGIVHEHGGCLGYETGAGVGTTFQLDLPVVS